jgi:hypothetical protein
MISRICGLKKLSKRQSLSTGLPFFFTPQMCVLPINKKKSKGKDAGSQVSNFLTKKNLEVYMLKLIMK